MNKILLTTVVAGIFCLSSCSVFKNPSKKVVATDQNVEQPAKVKKDKNKADRQKPAKTGNVKTENMANDKSKQADAMQILNGEWTIQEVNGSKTTGDERPYIYFESSTGRFYGSNGCNTLNGSFTVKAGGKLSFSEVISSLKMCHDAPFEFAINGAIDQVRGFAVEKSGNETLLSLRSETGKTVMLLRRHNLDYLNGAWKVISLNGQPVDNDNVKFVIDIPELKLHGNAGCNIVNGSILIDPDKSDAIQFQQLATTRMMCPDIQLETQILVALEEVGKSERMKDNKVLLTNSDGSTKIILEKMDLKAAQDIME